jgi:hypothetical protein
MYYGSYKIQRNGSHCKIKETAFKNWHYIKEHPEDNNQDDQTHDGESNIILGFTRSEFPKVKQKFRYALSDYTSTSNAIWPILCLRTAFRMCLALTETKITTMQNLSSRSAGYEEFHLVGYNTV